MVFAVLPLCTVFESTTKAHNLGNWCIQCWYITQRSVYAESTLDFSGYSQHCVQGPQGFMFERHEARASSSCRKNMAE